MEIKTPDYRIAVHLAADGQSGQIDSDLPVRSLPAKDPWNVACDTLESLILAHACAGIKIDEPAYAAGVQTTVEAMVNWLT